MKAKLTLSALVRSQKERLLVGAILLGLAVVSPVPAMAGVNVDVNIALPPPIFLNAPPEVVVIPETYVYAVPDYDGDLYFYDGWWWRSWEGRWYRSRFYSSGWVYYQRVPSFYVVISPHWRNDYRDHRWAGHPWNYQPIPHDQLQQNWRGWQENRHWEKQQTWGVPGLKPQNRPQRPAQAMQPGSQAKPRMKNAPIQQQSRPQELQPRHGQPQREGGRQKAKPQRGKRERAVEENQERKQQR